MRPQPLRKLNPAKIRHRHRERRPRRQQTIEQRTDEQMPTHPPPPRRQRRGRIPAHAEAQRQGVADDDADVAGVVRDGVGGCGIDGAGVGGARRGVQQDVEVVGDVQVRELQGAGDGDDEGDVEVVGGGGGGGDGEAVDGGGGGGGGGGGEGPRGDAAGHGGVVVDVEFEEVEEWVGDEGDGAVYVLGAV